MTSEALNSPPRHPPLGEQVQAVLDEGAELVKDYLQLARASLKKGADAAKHAMVALALSAVFGLWGVGEVIYGIVGLIAARTEVVREQTRIATTSGVICIVIALICAWIAVACLKRAQRSPKDIIVPMTTPEEA